MTTQCLLPILSDTLSPGRPQPGAQAIRHRAEVEYREIGTREILNRSGGGRLPFSWTINPYRGCEFACTYCYARYTHHFFDLRKWRDFEDRIFVKRGAAESLRRRLKRTSFEGQPIAIGTVTDPYQPAERHYGVTRALLDVLREVSGLEISITTKSPLISRDIDLLAELDRKHSITVQISFTTVDAELARRMERRAPGPDARLRVLRELSDAGIATAAFCMPILPAINDNEETLSPLLEAVRDHGAFDVVASPLYLPRAAKGGFLEWLEQEFPEHTPMYRKLFANRDRMREDQKVRLLRRFRRLRMEHGFPVAVVGRN